MDSGEAVFGGGSSGVDHCKRLHHLSANNDDCAGCGSHRRDIGNADLNHVGLKETIECIKPVPEEEVSTTVAMFQSLALKNGATLRDNARVMKISNGWKLRNGSNGVLVCVSRGSVLGRESVIAAGAWAQKFAKEIAQIELPVQPIHTTIAYWKIKEGLDNFLLESGFPTFACYNDPYFYGTPTLEYPGLLTVSIHGGYPCDPDKRTLVPDLDVLKTKVSPWLAEGFRGHIMLENPILAEACMYSMSPDEDFILDFLPVTKTSLSSDMSPILIASGFYAVAQMVR